MIFAEKRSSATQFELGQLFRKANDDTRDYGKAASWFQHSAKQGYRKAQYKLGLMYARGLGVSRDYIQAYAWLKVAASQGSHKAACCLKKYAPRIPESQQLEAHALCRDYYQKYVVPFSS
ncbi:MAG: sel1 repeat family protein [Gammaproteobacteria bacterium]|nr:sel1 repeat family protein [Gammaproteobacteria bacterium]MBL6999150.1 sel1 repeat family protein [Gammaproteobacteria bacterium]